MGRRVGNSPPATGSLPVLIVAVPRIERRGKDGAFLPLEGEHVLRITLPDLRASLSGEDQRLLSKRCRSDWSGSRRDLAIQASTVPRALEEDVGASAPTRFPGLSSTVGRDGAALVDGMPSFCRKRR